MSTTTSRYLQDNFGPVTSEVTAEDLPVTGRIPDALEGRYLRNGPNPVAPPDPATYHWFTGDGMVHGIRLRGGRAEWYRNRWVRSAAVAGALGEDVRPGPVHGDMDFAANTNVVGQGGRTFAIVEAGSRPYELTYDLDTVGPTDFGGTLEGGYTAHPKRDPDTGELHAMSYFWGWGNRVQYTVIGTDGRVRHTVDVEVGASPMMHDFSLTEGNVVIYDLPVTFNLELAMGGASFPYAWDASYVPRVGVLPRAGTAADVRWFEVEPCYVFHPLNSYDDGDDRIVLDVVRHPKMFDVERLGPDEGPPTLERWTIDLSSGKVIEERLDDRAQEFPRVDERLVGKRHRFGYSAAAKTDGRIDLVGAAVLKHDLERGTVEAREMPAGTSAGEVVFVPESPDAGEDEGWLLTFAYDPARDTSDFVILDARDIAGEPVATVALPQRVPYGFHGNWVPD